MFIFKKKIFTLALISYIINYSSVEANERLAIRVGEEMIIPNTSVRLFYQTTENITTKSFTHIIKLKEGDTVLMQLNTFNEFPLIFDLSEKQILFYVSEKKEKLVAKFNLEKFWQQVDEIPKE